MLASSYVKGRVKYYFVKKLMLQLLKNFVPLISGNGKVYENDSDICVFGDFKMSVKPRIANIRTTFLFCKLTVILKLPHIKYLVIVLRIFKNIYL